MKRRFIILVIIAITLSLLGLVSIQLYWINNALSVKEVNFDRGVSEAAGRTIQKFNKLMLTRKMLSQREKGEQMNELFFMLDSLNQLYYQQMVTGQSSRFPRDSTGEDTSTRESNLQTGEYDDDFLFHWFDPAYQDNQGVLYGSGGYLPNQRNQLLEDPFAAFFERSRMINDLFENMFTNRYSFQMSAGESVKILDSLLSKEFLSAGIKTQYEFGIFNPVMNTFSGEKTGKFTQQMLQSQYFYSLFPEDIFLNPDYLFLYFPDQKQYILSQMNAILATSALFIMIIISSFAFTIMTIIRQKKLSQMKTDFINNMTHELKTPISTISLACQALSDQDIGKSELLYQNYISMISEENKRLGSMTEKVLQTALLENGKLRLNVSGLDIHEVIDNAAQKIGLQVEARNGKITTSLNAPYSFIRADKVHLTGVFINLLDNANKYSPVNPQIHITTENSNYGVIIHVDDNGIGISRANQKKIFDNLYRVSTGNVHDVKGFGLGLSYVKAIVDKHGGWVKVQSEPKKGSRFSVFIPFGLNGYPSNQNPF